MNRKIVLFLIIVFSLVGISFTILLKPRMQFNKLVVSEEEWNIIVTEREEGDISLKSLKFNDYDLIIDEKNNKVYYSIIDSSASKYSPFVSFSASNSNAKISILNDEITDDKIMNNHEFKMLLYDNKTYKTYGLYCTTFPMLNVICDENENKANASMSMYLFNNFDNGINRVVKSDGTISKVEMEDGTYNYRFSLTMITPGNNERENVISLLQMKPSNEYFLNAINVGKNNSPIRNNMRGPMGRREKFDIPSGDIKKDFASSGEVPKDMKLNDRGPMAPNNQTPKNEQSIELFMNNEYIGLYSLGYNPDTKIRPKNN